MVTLEKITALPNFSSQLENKILYSEHTSDIEIQYESACSIKYVIEGTKEYNHSCQDSLISSGQYIILNNKNISTRALKGSKGLSLFLSPDLIGEIYSNLYARDTTSLEFFEFPQSNHNLIGAELQKMAFLYENQPNLFKLQMDDLFIHLSETVIKEHVKIKAKFSELKIIKYNTQKELYKYVTMAQTYMHDNFTRKISLDTLSNAIGVSKYYLHRLFTEIMGYTPIEYLTFIRLNSAKEQLRLSKKTIFEITVDNGFESSSYFSNVFKKYFGITPTTYRKQ